jgi:hypothetical protein
MLTAPEAGVLVLDLPPARVNVQFMQYGVILHEEHLTWKSPNIDLSGQIDLIING